MPMTNIELGNYLCNIRKNLDLSTYEVNALSGISPSYLSLIENGKRKASAVILKKLAPIYKLDYLDLYEKAGYIDLIKEKSTDTKLNQLHQYMNENNLDEIALIPIYDNINLRIDWKTTPVGYTPFDFKINSCSEDKSYFYYKISENSMNIAKDTYILIEDTEDVNVNDIILYSANNHIELGIYKLSLKQEQNFKILGKYIK